MTRCEFRFKIIITAVILERLVMDFEAVLKQTAMRNVQHAVYVLREVWKKHPTWTPFQGQDPGGLGPSRPSRVDPDSSRGGQSEVGPLVQPARLAVDLAWSLARPRTQVRHILYSTAGTGLAGGQGWRRDRAGGGTGLEDRAGGQGWLEEGEMQLESACEVSSRGGHQGGLSAAGHWAMSFLEPVFGTISSPSDTLAVAKIIPPGPIGGDRHRAMMPEALITGLQQRVDS